MDYKASVKIAKECFDYIKATIDKAYKINDVYVFDSNVEYCGYLPIVVDSNGNTCNLWHYLNETNSNYDDLTPVDLSTGDEAVN